MPGPVAKARSAGPAPACHVEGGAVHPDEQLGGSESRSPCRRPSRAPGRSPAGWRRPQCSGCNRSPRALTASITDCSPAAVWRPWKCIRITPPARPEESSRRRHRTFWTICDVVVPAQSRVSTVQKHRQYPREAARAVSLVENAPAPPGGAGADRRGGPGAVVDLPQHGRVEAVDRSAWVAVWLSITCPSRFIA